MLHGSGTTGSSFGLSTRIELDRQEKEKSATGSRCKFGKLENLNRKMKLEREEICPNFVCNINSSNHREQDTCRILFLLLANCRTNISRATITNICIYTTPSVVGACGYLFEEDVQIYSSRKGFSSRKKDGTAKGKCKFYLDKARETFWRMPRSRAKENTGGRGDRVRFVLQKEEHDR